MKRAFCDKDHDEYVLVIRRDNFEQVMAGIECAKKHGAWCWLHQVAHIKIAGGIGDGTMCQKCFDFYHMVLQPLAARLAGSLGTLLPETEQKRLREWVEDMRGTWEEGDWSITLRGIVMEALRRGVLPHIVVDDCIAAKSVDAILPRAY